VRVGKLALLHKRSGTTSVVPSKTCGPEATAKRTTSRQNAFDTVNLYGTAVASYSIGGLPGQFSPSLNWSNQPQPNFTDPFGPLTPAQIPQAVGNLLGVAPGKGLIVNEKDESWFFIANLSQYLFLREDPASVAEKLKTGQVLNGIGFFGRIGFAPEETNQITRDASIALFAHGMLGARKYDSFGAGFFLQ